jgi:hypothetical protein
MIGANWLLLGQRIAHQHDELPLSISLPGFASIARLTLLRIEGIGYNDWCHH